MFLEKMPHINKVVLRWLLFNCHVFTHGVLTSFGKKDIFCLGEANPVSLCCGVVWLTK